MLGFRFNEISGVPSGLNLAFAIPGYVFTKYS